MGRYLSVKQLEVVFYLFGRRFHGNHALVVPEAHEGLASADDLTYGPAGCEQVLAQFQETDRIDDECSATFLLI